MPRVAQRNHNYSYLAQTHAHIHTPRNNNNTKEQKKTRQRSRKKVENKLHYYELFHAAGRASGKQQEEGEGRGASKRYFMPR